MLTLGDVCTDECEHALFLCQNGEVILKDWKHTYIGEGVVFDSLDPENIIVGAHTQSRCIKYGLAILHDRSRKGYND